MFLANPRYNLSMPSSYEEVRHIAYELPEDQRILRANWLWDSIEQDGSEATEAEFDAAWDTEIGRRVAGIQAGNAATCSLEEVEAGLRAIVEP